jgi:PAS domain-containing protein
MFAREHTASFPSLRLATVLESNESFSPNSVHRPDDRVAYQVAAASRDLGARKETETHREQRGTRYRALLQAAPDAMVISTSMATFSW